MDRLADLSADTLSRMSKPKLVKQINDLRARLGKPLLTPGQEAGLKARTKFGLAQYVMDLMRQIPNG